MFPDNCELPLKESNRENQAGMIRWRNRNSRKVEKHPSSKPTFIRCIAWLSIYGSKACVERSRFYGGEKL
jgi:hypothetical protein